MATRRSHQHVETVRTAFPPEVSHLLGGTTEEAAAWLKQLALIELFRRGDVSSGYAAQVLGIDRWDFIQLLGKHSVPYIDVSDEELSRQVEAARPGKPPPPNPQSPTQAS
jgi:predicted HTH domain antitoxin